jgi:acetoin utilization deacetylase AcuC-like enzyme
MTLRVFSDRRCLEHRVPFGFPENEERLKRILGGLAGGWPMTDEGVHRGVDDAIAAVHGSGYIESFRRAVERGDGLLGSSDNPLSAGTWVAARAAVETTLQAVDWALETPGGEGFVAVRPPGHHAERDLAMGFCFFNNVAVAAQYLVEIHGMERVAVFDFDVHHGNGTQHIFEERPDVLYISTHQWPFYPGTGSADEIGRGAGRGATLNIPLSGGKGDDDYRAVFRHQVVPALYDFSPDFLLISAGFDAWRADPVGGMRVTDAGFAEWGRLLREVATCCCEGRLISLLEGGYDLAALPVLVDSYLRGEGRGANMMVSL